jgi:hypothetical protein
MHVGILVVQVAALSANAAAVAVTDLLTGDC